MSRDRPVHPSERPGERVEVGWKHNAGVWTVGDARSSAWRGSAPAPKPSKPPGCGSRRCRSSSHDDFVVTHDG